MGRILKQLNLYTRADGRKDGKRAYRFSLKHVQNIFNRFNGISGIGGIGGQVVLDKEQQALVTEHLKNRGGLSGKGGSIGGQKPLDNHLLPPIENKVVSRKPLIQKDDNHLATYTTYLHEDKNNTLAFIDLTTKEIELVEE